MVPALIIVFREGFEAFLSVAVILAFLKLFVAGGVTGLALAADVVGVGAFRAPHQCETLFPGDRYFPAALRGPDCRLLVP